MKLNELTIKEAETLLRTKAITSVALTQACFKHIQQIDRKIKACLALNEKKALRAAQAADDRIKKGQTGTLLGIPFLIKDNIMAEDLITTAGSKILKNYKAPYTATVVQRLEKAGAVLLGKTNLDEFAHGSSTEYSAFGPTKNPWDLKRVPGGSSGGSAAAVAADMCLFALGTDTGGSVRHPAAFCGVTGFKPTYGLCSRFGLIAMTSSTDVPGILAKNPQDAQAVLAVMMGQDDEDATTLSVTKSMIERKINSSWKGITVGIPKEYMETKLAPSVRSSFQKTLNILKKAGARLVSIRLPLTPYAVAAYYIITPAEISSNLARFDGIRYGEAVKAKTLLEHYIRTREAGFGPEVKRRIILGTFALSAGYADAYYHQAQAIREGIKAEFTKAWEKCQVIVTPSTPTPAFAFGAKKNPLAMYLEDVFSVPASLAGLPAVSVPIVKQPLPIGLQLIGAPLADFQVLTLGKKLDEMLSLKAKPKL